MTETKKFSLSGDKIFGLEPWQIKALVPLWGVVLMIIVSIGLVVLPKIEQIGNFSKEIEVANKNISELNQKRAYIQSADESELKSRQEVLLMSVPEDKDIYFLLTTISNMVTDHGYIVQALSFSPGEVKDSSTNKIEEQGTVGFSLTLVGPKNRYIELVEGIETSLPIMSIASIDSKTLSGDLFEITMKLNTYYVTKLAKVDINKLSYKDLVMTKSELELIDKLASFTKTSGLRISNDKLETGQKYEEYEIRNPFLLTN